MAALHRELGEELEVSVPLGPEIINEEAASWFSRGRNRDPAVARSGDHRETNRRRCPR